MSKEVAMAWTVGLSGHIPGEAKEEYQLGCLVSEPIVLARMSLIWNRFPASSNIKLGKRHVQMYY
jgi:hypothetical protein